MGRRRPGDPERYACIPKTPARPFLHENLVSGHLGGETRHHLQVLPSGLARSPQRWSHVCASMNASSWLLLKLPTRVATGCPSLNSMSVGMLRTLYRVGVAGFSSTFNFTTLSLSAYSLADCSTIGPIIRHGPHHS